MADYAKSTLVTKYSESSDYSDNMLNRSVTKEQTTPTKVVIHTVTATTSGVTVDLGNFTTILSVAIENQDTTNFVEAKWRYTKASKTFSANKLGFANANPDTIADDDSTFVSSLRARAGDYVVVSGTAEAGNTGTFLVQAVAAGTLTLASAESLTVDTDDAGTPTIITTPECEARITAGEFMRITNVRPENDLVLTANTASCECLVIVYGT